MAHQILYQPESTKTDMYCVYVDDIVEYNKWLEGDSSIALASFVGKFEVYHSMQGAQGQWSPAGKGQLSSDLECEDKDEALEIVLRKGGEQMGDRLAGKLNKDKWTGTNDANSGGFVVSSGAMHGGKGGR
ncbi:hypothetical protein P389DRAFT_186908 [Cystobasidium minutum MCA 4210]|uniref:uncharacterized protein n=1 Tax=Cystobasidium minutum MCA 4210 TaxID=1397322 RepID=UPI0034CE96C4|eukprot:jgi/Rhomi1/186908/estExt_fgenesh1_pg.C_1_t10149